MHNDLRRSYGLLDSHRKLAIDNLKRCPVCDTVNAMMNMECFVCRWHGEFDHDPISVEAGLYEVLEQCPELIDCILNLPTRRESVLVRARDWFRRKTRKALDLEV
jgi:hypothetical protein